MTRSRTATTAWSATSALPTACVTAVRSALPVTALRLSASPDLSAPSASLAADLRISAKPVPEDAAGVSRPGAAVILPTLAYAAIALAMVAISFVPSYPPRSAAQQVDGAGDHRFCRIDGGDVGFVAALRLVHVHHLDEGIDVGHEHVALRVGGGMGGVVAPLELALAGHDVRHLDDVGADRLVEHALEGDDLAPIRLAARRLRTRFRVREILGDDAQPRALRVEAGEGDLQRLVEAHGSALPQPVGLRPSTSLIMPICWRSRLVVSA